MAATTVKSTRSKMNTKFVNLLVFIALGPKALRNIPRTPFSTISEEAIKLFNISPQKAAKIKQDMAALQPRVQSGSTNGLSREDKKLGFNHHVLD
jgi:hypothetical protein